MSYKFSVKAGALMTVAIAVSVAISSVSAQTNEPLRGENLGEQIANVTQDFLNVAREDSSKVREVTDALLSLDMAYYQTLLDHAQDKDPEVRARILSVIRSDITDTRIRRVFALLSKEKGDKLRMFQKSRPQLFREFFSSELSDRVRATKVVGKMKDPKCMAEPLLVLCMKHPARELATAAIASASNGTYKSDTLVDVLIDIIEKYGVNPNRYYHNQGDSLPPGLEAMDTLQSIATPYVSAKLFELTFSGHGGNMNEDILLAEALAATSDKHIIPHLIKELKNTDGRSSRSTGELRASYARSDAALLVLLRLTAQSISEYKLVYFKQYNYVIFGFAKEADRKLAIKKFEKWWKENKSQPAYKDIKPLNLDRKSGTKTRRPASPTTKRSQQRAFRKATLEPEPKSATQPTTRPTTQPATQPTTQLAAIMPDIEGLKADISAETQRLIKIFHDINFRTRENTQAHLLAIRTARDNALSADIDNENKDIRKLVLGIMANSMAEAKITQTLIKLDEADRKKLLEFRAGHNDVFRDAMSLTWSKNMRAVKKIGRQKLVKAEPLLLLTMKHSYEPVVLASIQAAGDAQCKSDAMVDALCKIVADAFPSDPSRGFNTYQFFDKSKTSGAALNVIKKLKSPRSLPHILAFMKNKYIQHNTQARFQFADIIASIGDISVIPELMKELDNSRNLGKMSSGKDSMSMASSDSILLALIKLTRQKSRAYKLIRWKHSYNNTRVYGFKKDEDRPKAIAKFKKWWAENKSKAPYKDIKPMAPLK